MRALITGIAGFAGSHLAEYLLDAVGLEIAGVLHPATGDKGFFQALSRRTELFEGDVTDFPFLERVLDRYRPDYVFHLAAQAAPSLAWSAAQETLTVNVLGQYNVLAAVAKTVPAATVLVVGSAEEYGRVLPSELPVRESNPLRPTSPYAVSKVAQDMLGYQFFLSHGLRAVRVRPFNHIGPRQSEHFATASFAAQIAAIEAGRQEPVVVTGNLDARRDFSDVRDMVRAYWLAVSRAVPGEVYNLGSGRSHSIAEVLELLLRQTTVKATVQQDPARLRPSDVPDLVCDAAKFRAQTGWQPGISLERSLADLLDYYRARLRQQ